MLVLHVQTVHAQVIVLFAMTDALLAETFVWLGLHADINESYRGICVKDESPIYLKSIKCMHTWNIWTEERCQDLKYGALSDLLKKINK